MEVSLVEKRSYIKIDVLRWINAMEYHSELVEDLGNNALPYRTVARILKLKATNQARSAMSTQSGTQVAASSSVGEHVKFSLKYTHGSEQAHGALLLAGGGHSEVGMDRNLFKNLSNAR
ncbi:hypothetical protein TNCV_4045761 [Trichonephila clavipes]|nr:hypothetical protein TNCV_4045761 [Trichonephila clavipes]